jgi:hypothetical protein
VTGPEFPGTSNPHAPYLGKASGHSHDPRPVGQRDEEGQRRFEEQVARWRAQPEPEEES